MKLFVFSKCSVLVLLAAPLLSRPQSAVKLPRGIQQAPFRVGKLLFQDDFQDGLSQWVVEAQRPGSISAQKGVLDIDVPAGLTLWFRPQLQGPVMISYDAVAASEGGPNDRVSDLNCFWMATDPSSPEDLFAHTRNGAFPSYDALRLYYVGIGGHDNTTTRFRRYSSEGKALRPEDDLRSAGALLVPNRSQHLRLIADGHLIQFYRDDRCLFQLEDPDPYTHGWFALRTTRSHLRIRNFKIFQLLPPAP